MEARTRHSQTTISGAAEKTGQRNLAALVFIRRFDGRVLTQWHDGAQIR